MQRLRFEGALRLKVVASFLFQIILHKLRISSIFYQYMKGKSCIVSQFSECVFSDARFAANKDDLKSIWSCRSSNRKNEKS